jgi:hypothetical protein
VNPDEPRRPRDLALLLLAKDDTPPRNRARDQQADIAGASIRRGLLDRVAAVDPEPEDLDEVLFAIVAELGDPPGPVRSVALGFREDWRFANQSPASWGFFLDEALHADEPKERRRR